MGKKELFQKEVKKEFIFFFFVFYFIFPSGQFFRVASLHNGLNKLNQHFLSYLCCLVLATIILFIFCIRKTITANLSTGFYNVY